MKVKFLLPPYLPQMKDGVINNDDILTSGKIFVEILQTSDAQIGDEIRLNFGQNRYLFFLINNPLTDFPIIFPIDEKEVEDGSYIVQYSVTDLLGNISYSPIAWAIVDRDENGVLPEPIFTDKNSNNIITIDSINQNNGTHIHVPIYDNITIGDIVTLLYWSIDINEELVNGSQYSITRTIEEQDIEKGFTILVPMAFVAIVNNGTCKAQYSVQKENINLKSRIGSAFLNLNIDATLPAPIFIDQIDGWLTTNNITNGIRIRASYSIMTTGDEIQLFISGYNNLGEEVQGTSVSQNITITSIDILNNYFEVTFSSNIALLIGNGRLNAYYTVVQDSQKYLSHIGSVNIDVINNVILPPPIFIQANSGILHSSVIENTQGAWIRIQYEQMAIGDGVTVHVLGTDINNQEVINASWSTIETVSLSDINKGYIEVLYPYNKALLVGDNGTIQGSYSVVYANMEGFDYSNSSQVRLELEAVGIDDLHIHLTTGAPPLDYETIHVNPYNRGMVVGTPGSTIILSCTLPANFLESSSHNHSVILNEQGIARFSLYSPSSGAIIVTGYNNNIPSKEVNATTQFKNYHVPQNKFLAWASTTSIIADGVMLGSIYLKTDIEGVFKNAITTVRAKITGNAEFVGYTGQIVDILLNSDHSLEIDLINKIEETVNVTLTLPESSGSIINLDIVFTNEI